MGWEGLMYVSAVDSAGYERIVRPYCASSIDPVGLFLAQRRPIQLRRPRDNHCFTHATIRVLTLESPRGGLP
jgi:hypothetical protein